MLRAGYAKPCWGHELRAENKRLLATLAQKSAELSQAKHWQLKLEHAAQDATARAEAAERERDEWKKAVDGAFEGAKIAGEQAHREKRNLEVVIDSLRAQLAEAQAHANLLPSQEALDEALAWGAELEGALRECGRFGYWGKDTKRETLIEALDHVAETAETAEKALSIDRPAALAALTARLRGEGMMRAAELLRAREDQEHCEFQRSYGDPPFRVDLVCHQHSDFIRAEAEAAKAREAGEER